MEANRPRVQPALVGPPSQPEVVPTAAVIRLGARLYERRAQVAARAELLGSEAEFELDPASQLSIGRILLVSTEAFARWMRGEGAETAREAGREAVSILAQLAVQRVVPLGEVTKCALRWRDATRDALDEIADEQGAAPETRRTAERMLQRSLDVTLVQIGEVVERERSRVENELVRRQQEVVFMATHDSLTHLPNRVLLIDRADRLLARAQREHGQCAALIVDLDSFKAINDGLGHGVGDALLCAVAERLRTTIREADTLGRLSGDEFVILVDGASLTAGPELVAERILDALRQPFQIDGAVAGRVTITATIGIATGVRRSATDLLRDADIARYRGKLSGGNSYLVFESGMEDVIQNRMELEMDLRDAVGNREFSIVYQPMFDLDQLEPVRMEALLRWRRTDAELVPPEEFVPVLEESGLISDVGRWVLNEACRRCAAWNGEGIGVGVSVNVSAVQLETDCFVLDVAKALAHSGLAPEALTIEITETSLMRDAERTAERLRAIKRLGVRLSIDDFGTGYSSLAYLQRFPVDELKIDRSFVSQLTSTAQRDALIRTFVQLGRALEIETVAEGIEDQAQLSHLRAEHCDIGQGFLFAKPMEAAECHGFLTRWAGAQQPGTTPVSAAR